MKMKEWLPHGRPYIMRLMQGLRLDAMVVHANQIACIGNHQALELGIACIHSMAVPYINHLQSRV